MKFQKHTFLMASLLLSLGLSACQQNATAPAHLQPRVLAKLELGINQASASIQTVLPDSSGSFTPTGAAEVCDNVTFRQRYISRSFRFTNTSGNTLANLVIHAYKKSGNTDGTALKSITDFGGQALTAARSPLPSNGMNCLGQHVDPARADMQVFDDAMTAARSNEALAATPPLLATDEYLLQYGYLVQQRNGDTDSDNNSRTIAPGETGTVTVALSNSLGSSTTNTYNFVMTFLLTADGDSELVQSLEDQLSDTVAGLSNQPAGVRKVTLFGGQGCSENPANPRVVYAFRFAGTPSGTGEDTPASAPNISPLPTKIIVTSSADSGPGSLRQAILDAAPMTEICFTKSIALNSEIVLDKILLISAGENVSLNGQGSTRIFRIQNNITVVLSGFSIINGSATNTAAGNEGGGAIRNDGNLLLFGMNLHDNSFYGAPANPGITNGTALNAQGGAIYNAGTLQTHTTRLWNNLAQASTGAPQQSIGQTGETGGSAYGGAIFNTSLGNALLFTSIVSQNTARGGMGGTGGPGMINVQGFPPTLVCLLPSGAGGIGGNANGGGLYMDQPSAGLYFPISITNNTVTAGNGGLSIGPLPCNIGQSISGNATNPNLGGI